MIKLATFGIDVSEFQGVIDWAKVSQSGVKFAMIRASYGTSSVDPMFDENVTNASQNGVLVGAYHYCYATDTNSATAEANNFLSTIKNYKINYPIALDIEDESQQVLSKTLVTDIALTFLTTLANANYYSMIYSDVSWFLDVLDDSKLLGFDHWVADWGSENTYTGVTGIWQYNSSGTINGINDNVDLDYGYKDFYSIIQQKGLNNL